MNVEFMNKVGNYKEFSPELYKQFDSSGKNAVYNYMVNKINPITQKPFDVVIREEDKSFDLYCNDLDCAIEVGVRNLSSWDTYGKFPFDDINVEGRRYFAFTKKRPDGSRIPCMMWYVSPKYQYAISMWGNDIIKCHQEENPNKYVSAREKFYKVPIERWNQIKLK